ncbi:hypothetical protein WP50_10010, partial [Lactiplantibacillus plantarum]
MENHRDITIFWFHVIHDIVVTLAGYVYSRYRFAGKKFSLTFFIVIQMVPTMAALTAYYVLANMLNALDHYWFLTAIIGLTNGKTIDQKILKLPAPSNLADSSKSYGTLS